MTTDSMTVDTARHDWLELLELQEKDVLPFVDLVDFVVNWYGYANLEYTHRFAEIFKELVDIGEKNFLARPKARPVATFLRSYVASGISCVWGRPLRLILRKHLKTSAKYR